MADPSRRLQDACAPFFLFLATFRRNAGSSSKDIGELRQTLERELRKVQEFCERDHELQPLWERVRYALVTTADQVILGSPWTHRAGWSMALQEAEVYGTREGGKRFFQLVEQTLADSSGEARAMAHVLVHCMGLGFQGELRNNRAELGRLRQRLFEKAQLPTRMDDRLTPDAYGRNSSKSVLKLPTVQMFRLVLVGLAAIVFALVAGNVVTEWTNEPINQQIDEIEAELEATGR
jgi:type IV/VI secretion system ImpK/VasF family protein